MRARLPLTLALLLVGLPANAAAQTGDVCGGLSRPLWSTPSSPTATPGHGWSNGRRAEPRCSLSFGGWLRTSMVSGTGVERPDGLAAPGGGLVTSALAGVVWSSDRFEVRIAPEIAWHQNTDADIPDSPFSGAREFSYPWVRFDWPTRYGTDSFSQVGLGNSGIRARTGRFSVGLDAEPFRWGPSRRYPLLLSGQGASFPRLDLRTDDPISLGKAGTLDLHLLWGRLDESDWYDDVEENSSRIMGGLMLAWAPGLLEGLELGFASVHHQYTDDFGLGSAFDFIQSPSEATSGNVEGNGLGEVWVQWSRPESGFDVWYEWAKDDYNRDFTHLLLEPEHNSARTFGFRQEVDWGSDRFAVMFETTRTWSAEPAIENQVPPKPKVYVHFDVKQGHTNRGQMLGSFVGTGGDGQFIDLRWMGESTTAVQFERLRWNLDAYVQEIDNTLLDDEGYDVEVVGRVIHERAFGDLRALGELEIGSRHNRYFLQDEDTLGWDGNTRLTLMLMWSR